MNNSCAFLATLFYAEEQRLLRGRLGRGGEAAEPRKGVQILATFIFAKNEGHTGKNSVRSINKCYFKILDLAHCVCNLSSAAFGEWLLIAEKHYAK